MKKNYIENEHVKKSPEIIYTWIAIISGNWNLFWWKQNENSNNEKNQFYLLLIWIEFKYLLKNKNTIRLNRSKADTRTYKILFENDTVRDYVQAYSYTLYIHTILVFSICMYGIHSFCLEHREVGCLDIIEYWTHAAKNSFNLQFAWIFEYFSLLCYHLLQHLWYTALIPRKFGRKMWISSLLGH